MPIFSIFDMTLTTKNCYPTMILDDIALTLDPAIEPRTAVHLIKCFGSAEGVFAASVAEMTGDAELDEDIARSIARREYHREAEKELEFAERNRIRVVPSWSEEYPRRLKECGDYPHVIYVKGETDLNSARWLSVVGTRKMTGYGRGVCEDIVVGLSKMFPELVVVSGLAYGIDVTAQAAAVKRGLASVAVLGTPMTRIYPSGNRSVARKLVDAGGALVSEYHSGHRTYKSDFVARNRIIAGLSEGVIVVESPEKGGSLYTADMADGYDRVVMAVPGRAGDRCSEGTNALIKSMKAHMVCSAADVAEAMGWEVSSKSTSRDMAVDNTAVLPAVDNELCGRIGAMLESSDPVSFDELCLMSAISAQELAAVLLYMEMNGQVRAMPGKMYMKR